MATTSDIDVSAGAEESVSLEEMVTELDQGGTVILDSSSLVANNLRLKLHEVRAEAFVENGEDDISYFSISSTDDSPGTERSPVTISANLERETWDDVRAGGDSEKVRGSSPFTLKKTVVKEGLSFEFELRVEPFYKVEGEDVIVRLELPTIMWGSNMEHNDKKKRGFFADIVVIRLTPAWQEDDRSPKKFFPLPSNDLTLFGRTNQVSLGATGSYVNPMATASTSRSTSQQSTVPDWIANWDGGHDGISAFRWRLNSWYPISGGAKFGALYKVKEFKKGEKADWDKFADVPELPSGYRDGKFNGFDSPPWVEWRVKGSTLRSNKISLNMSIEVRTSCFSVHHGYIMGKVMKAFRGLKWKPYDVIIHSDQPIRLASGRNSSYDLWVIISLVLVVALVVWELGVRDFFT